MAATDRLLEAALETNVTRTPNEEMYRCYRFLGKLYGTVRPLQKLKNSANLGLDAQK